MGRPELQNATRGGAKPGVDVDSSDLVASRTLSLDGTKATSSFVGKEPRRPSHEEDKSVDYGPSTTRLPSSSTTASSPRDGTPLPPSGERLSFPSLAGPTPGREKNVRTSSSSPSPPASETSAFQTSRVERSIENDMVVIYVSEGVSYLNKAALEKKGKKLVVDLGKVS
mmetsp:Transcript_9206/g.29903  ORF Transcript_9206/g.29903 Transcript_9206/m.29903 type:complete len:169 (-) Transcript_9206:887-1393(-)